MMLSLQRLPIKSTLMSIAAQSFTYEPYKNNYNGMYSARPVWAAVSNSATTPLVDPVVATYGAANPYIPLNVEGTGSFISKNRTFTDEMTYLGYAFCGTTSATATQAFSPQTGLFGIGGSTQTRGLNNFDIADNGDYGYYNAVTAHAVTVAMESGVVVGESNWRQCYDLILTNGGLIYKEPIGSGLIGAVDGNRPMINLLSMGNFISTGYWGYGYISHNRNTGHLLIVQPITGSSGSYAEFRFHIFNLQNKISVDTTIAELESWIGTALDSPLTYNYHDVTMDSATWYVNGMSEYDIFYSRFVLCNNDEVWMFKSSSSVETGNTYCNALFAVNLTGGTFVTGTYTATQLATFPWTNVYGWDQSVYGGVRHMNSDDNTVVALYQNNYYYLAGINIAMVSTANAAATSFNYSDNLQGIAGYSVFTIAPCGGPNFVLGYSGSNVVDAGHTIAFFDNQVLSAASIVPVFSTCLWPAYGTPACYQGTMVIKVQPTTEWQ
jgi:hypothetical protein